MWYEGLQKTQIIYGGFILIDGIHLVLVSA